MWQREAIRQIFQRLSHYYRNEFKQRCSSFFQTKYFRINFTAFWHFETDNHTFEGLFLPTLYYFW